MCVMIIAAACALCAILWSAPRLAAENRRHVTTLTEAELADEIEWAAGFGDSESIFYDERKRRDAAPKNR